MVTMVRFMVRTMRMFSFRTMVVMLRAALVAMAVEMLSRYMWRGVKMYLEVYKNLTRSFTTNIKIGLLSGILQPVKLIENI